MEVNGIKFEVFRKNIKNAHLYVKPPYGKIEVSCPLNYSDENIKLFVRTRLGWIKKQQESFYNQARQSKREYVSGETVYLLGKQYYLQVDYTPKTYNISIDCDKVIFEVRKNSTTEQREKVFNNWYRSILKKELDVLIPKWESKTGLNCAGFLITNMKAKWGSFNAKSRKVNLNLQLVKKSIVCIEYIILHELAHSIEKTHNNRFLAILDKYMPTWKEIKDLLNAQCLDSYLE